MAREIQSIPVTFASTGIIIKSTPDEIPITAYKMLSNAHTDRENSISVRKGFTRLNSGLPVAPYSSYYMKDAGGTPWRYAIAGGELYVAPVTDPDDASIWPIDLGSNFAAVIGGGNLSGNIDPRALWTTFALQGSEMRQYAFMADGVAFLKHAGGMDSARRIGIPRPANPILNVAKVAVSDSVIEAFEDYTQWTGGSATQTTAPYYPAIWFYGDSYLSSRWYYAKYSFTLNDDSETFCSEANYPRYIPRLKAARMHWQTAKYSYEALEAAHPSSWFGIGFNDATYPYIPVGARVCEVRIGAGSRLDRLQFIWQTADGTKIQAPAHGGSGGTQYKFILDDDEYITEIKGRYGSTYIDHIYIVTNKRQSQKYGSLNGDHDFSITMPVATSTQSPCLVGLNGKANQGGDQASPILTGIGFVVRWDTYDDTVTPPVDAVGWNLYVGSSPDNVRKVNVDPIALGTIFDEPQNGFEYLTVEPQIPNVGVISDDASGDVGHAVKLTVTGAGKSGSAYKVLTNDVGYPTVKDFGVYDPEELFKLSIKFSDADSKSNCLKIRLKFIISDIAGDLGTKYKYFATAEITDFTSYTPGAYTQAQLDKSDFVFNNYAGLTFSELSWATVSAVSVEVLTKDPVSGSGESVVSFDTLMFSPRGKLSGSNFQWTYTFYDSLTDTESDYADPFANTLGTLTNEQVQLEFPPTPLTTPPMANPDKVRIYRIGGTLTDFQRVGEIDYVPGFAFLWIDNTADEEAGDILEEDNQLPPEQVKGVEIWNNRMWSWGGVSLDGISEPLNRLRFSKGTRIEHFPSDNYIYVGSGNEEIMRVLEHDGELFVFTSTRPYRIVGQDGNYRAQSAAVNQGLTNKFCACRGARGIYIRSYDGIYEFPNGRKISEPINPIFFGETVNGIDPIAAGREAEEAMGFADSKLVFSYCSTTDTEIRNDRSLVWDTLYERWGWRIYGAQSLFFEPETNILIGGNITQWYSLVPGTASDIRRTGPYPMRLDDGNGDECVNDLGYPVTYGIPCIIDTKEYDLGFPDQEKQFIELVVDADTQGYPVILQASFDGGEFESIGIIQTADRQRVAFPIILGEENSRMAMRMSVRMQFESDPDADASTRIYKIVHRVLLEPPRHRTHVTDWDYCGNPGPKYFSQFYIEMDTFGHPLEKIEVQVDHETVQTITDNIMADGRQKFYYGIGVDVRGTLARLKIFTDEDWEVKIYDMGFEVIPEPPLLNVIQTPWTDNGFPYRKLWKHVELDIDTEGKLIEFSFWLDNLVAETFQISTDVREKVVHSFGAELFGKLGRLTVDAPALDTDDVPQGVRMYVSPLFITDQRNPDVTLADSFEQTLNYERKKIAKQLYYVVENPNAEVSLTVSIDNTTKDTFTIAANGDIYPKYSVRRMDFPSGYKGRLFRFSFSSTQPFEIDWAHSHVVLRDVNTEETHRRPRLEPPATY